MNGIGALCYENKEARDHTGVLQPVEDKAFMVSKTMNLFINPECVQFKKE